jgi:hypothetical protein
VLSVFNIKYFFDRSHAMVNYKLSSQIFTVLSCLVSGRKGILNITFFLCAKLQNGNQGNSKWR